MESLRNKKLPVHKSQSTLFLPGDDIAPISMAATY